MTWPSVQLKDVCTFMTGGTPSTKDEANYADGDIPWIASGDIHRREIFDASKRITQKGMEESPAKFLPENSVLIALNGQGRTRATVALLRMPGATCNQSIVAIIPNSPRTLDYRYLFMTLRSMYQQLRNLTGDKNRAGLNMRLIGNVRIPLPPLAEQKRIAGILDTADAMRTRRRESLAQLDALLQSTFLNLFGDGKRNPNCWPVAPIGDLTIDVRGGASLRPEDFTSTGFPVLHKGAIKPRGVVELDGGKKTYASEEYAQSKPHSVVTREFTVVTLRDLVPSGPSIGLAAHLGNAPYSEHLLAQGTYGFRLDQTRIVPDYFVALSNDAGFRTIFKRFSVGSTQIHIRNPIYQKIQVPLPPLDLQHRFATIAESIEQQRASQRAHLAELDTLFASLQQRAFRGDL